MKKTLLKSAGYAGLEDVKFPAEVDAEYDGLGYLVGDQELERISGQKISRGGLFFIPGVEII